MPCVIRFHACWRRLCQCWYRKRLFIGPFATLRSRPIVRKTNSIISGIGPFSVPFVHVFCTSIAHATRTPRPSSRIDMVLQRSSSKGTYVDVDVDVYQRPPSLAAHAGVPKSIHGCVERVVCRSEAVSVCDYPPVGPAHAQIDYL